MGVKLFCDYYRRLSENEPGSLKSVQWASDDRNVLFHDMGIDFSSLHISMAHQFLNNPDVNPVFKQVSGPALKGGINCTMPKGMTTDRFGNSRPSYGGLHRFLETGFKDMVTSGCS